MAEPGDHIPDLLEGEEDEEEREDQDDTHGNRRRRARALAGEVGTSPFAARASSKLLAWARRVTLLYKNVQHGEGTAL
jgi:hypothetical protein